MLVCSGAFTKLPDMKQLMVIMMVLFCVPETWASQVHHNKVLLVLLDGMRWDAELSSLQRMAENGVRADQLRPCFPAESFPNYYCIATGLYPESHGMLGNNIYDVESDDSFKIDLNWPNDRNPKWWDDGQPIWVTALKQGRRVRLYHWPGCEMTIGGIHLTSEQCIPYTGYMNGSHMAAAIEDAVHQLAEDKVDFVAIYQEQPDGIQHKYGVGSSEALQVLETLDEALTLLLDGADNRTVTGTRMRLADVLNVLVVSDHGHIYLHADPVNVTAVLDMSDVHHILTSGSVVSIWPKEGRAHSIYAALSDVPHLSVYWKQDIPSRLHYKNHRLVAPIITITDTGYATITPDSPVLGKYHSIGSTHGFDSDHLNMSGIFVAAGPNFRPGMRPAALDSVQLYQIMCSILGADAAPNNGSWQEVKGFLHDLQEPTPQFSSARHILPSIGLVLFVTCIITLFY